MTRIPTLDDLEAFDELVRARASAACSAAEDLARAANGNNGRVIPAPTAYSLLGNTKALLWYLREVIEFLPHGLENSLSDPRFTVTDSKGEPAELIAIANTELRTAHDALRLAAAALEDAQTTINSQGLQPKPELV